MSVQTLRAEEYRSDQGSAIWKSDDYGDVMYSNCRLGLEASFESTRILLDRLSVDCAGTDHEAYDFAQHSGPYEFLIQDNGDAFYANEKVGTFHNKVLNVTFKNAYEERIYTKISLLPESQLKLEFSLDSFDYPCFDFWSDEVLKPVGLKK